jgi:hypothetical protein
VPDVSEGWGRLTWGQAGYGQATTIQQGWGRLGWGKQAYGDSPIVTLSGLSATTSVGAPTIEVRPGWGTLDWGENGWGSVEEGIENLIAPAAATSSVGAITPADVVGLTGVSATSNVGTNLTFVISPTITPDGQVATASEGQLSLNDGADHVQGLATLVATTSVGSITPADVVGISGVSATASVGPDLVITDTQVVDLQDLAAGATSSIGSVIIEVEYILSGQSVTSAVGSISPEDVMGLTGVSATVTVGNIAPLGYGDIDITGNTSYSAVNKTNSASYSDVDVSGNTSYTDVTHAA